MSHHLGTSMPADHEPVHVGIDIGGTKIAVLVCDDRRIIVARGEVPAPAAQGGAAMADAAASLVRSLTSGRTVRAVGVGAAGVVDHDTGTIRAASSTFVDWVGFPLSDELSDRLDCPVVVENDVNAFLLGEAEPGESDVLGVMLGTGVGGAVILNGELRRGPHGAAGEIGHTPGYSDLVCTCGQSGHLETLASGTSIARRYVRRTGHEVAGSRDVAVLAESGDADALTVFRDAGRALGRACASAATLLDVSHAIVGGGVTRAWHLLQPGIDDALHTDAPITGIPLHIRPAAHGTDAVALGAIESARSLALASAH